MSLEDAFQQLVTQIQALHDALGALRITVVEDRPLKDSVMLVDELGNTLEDLSGWLSEASMAATEGQIAVNHPSDLQRARRALITCQKQFYRASQQFNTRLASYEQVAELTSLGYRRGGEWHAWVKSVKVFLDRCQRPMSDVNQTLFACWQEISDRLGTTTISVQATNIGQQITVPEAKEAARETIT